MSDALTHAIRDGRMMRAAKVARKAARQKGEDDARFPWVTPQIRHLKASDADGSIGSVPDCGAALGS